MKKAASQGDSARAQGLLGKLSIAALAAGLMGLGQLPLGSVASAQDAPTQASDEDEIVVTARLREERLTEVPVAVTALSGEQLENYNVSSLADVSSFVPSMVVGRQVTGSSASIFLRGVGSSSLSAGFDQSVSFNLDGLPMSRGRELLFSQYDVQQVEVLKGPQALFFGRNTTGGLVSITTNGPSNDLEASLRLGYGPEGEEVYSEGVLSGALSDNFRARLAFRASGSDGIFENTAPATSVDTATGFQRVRASDRRGANDVLSGRLTLEFDPLENLSFALKVGATEYEDSGAADLYERICGGGRTTPRPTQGVADPYADCSVDGRTDHSNLPTQVAPGMRYARDGEPYTDLSSQFAILNGNWRFDNFDLSSITGYYQFDQSDLGDFNGSTRAFAVSQLAEFEQLSQEFRLQTDFDGPVNAMFGVFYSETDFIFNTDAYIAPFPFDAVNNTYVTFRRDDGFNGTTLSAFGELSWDITPQLELAAGARWSHDEKDSYQQSLQADSAANAQFPPNVRFEDNYDEENVSPQVTLTWSPTDNYSTYAAYREGFKAGGFNLSQTIVTGGASAAAARFGSETASGWEVGYHGVLFDRRLRLNAAIYDYVYEDLQVQFFNPTTIAQVVANAGELETRGAEIDFNWRLPAVEGLSIHGAVAYNQAEYANFIGQCYGGQSVAQGCNQNLIGLAYTGQVYSGRTAPKAPEWGAQLGAAYEFPVGADWSATITADANYTSEYNFTDTLRPDAWQDEFTRVDASLSLQNENGIRFSIIGRNLTEEYVVTSANDMSSTGSTPAGTGTVAGGVVTDMNGIVERPREVYVEVGFAF